MIRETTKKDLSRAFDFLRDAWIDTYVDLGVDKSAILLMFKNKEDWITGFEIFLDLNDSISYVAFEKEKIIGLVFGKIGKIQSLYIDSKSRRKGFGKILLEKFIQQGLPVCLSVLEINKSAQKFYLKNGFKQTGKHTYFLIGTNKYKDLEFLRM